jgi:hypothetical protein
MNIQIQNEVINYLSTGARADFFYHKGTIAVYDVILLNLPQAISGVTIKIYAKQNGDLLHTFIGGVTPPDRFVWAILFTDFANDKPLNYWVEAVDQSFQLLFYGSFTLM